jgi:hypothetical protein
LPLFDCTSVDLDLESFENNVQIPNDGKTLLMKGDKVALGVSIGINTKDRQWSFKLIPHWVALFKKNGPRRNYESPQNKRVCTALFK